MRYHGIYFLNLKKRKVVMEKLSHNQFENIIEANGLQELSKKEMQDVNGGVYVSASNNMWHFSGLGMQVAV